MTDLLISAGQQHSQGLYHPIINQIIAHQNDNAGFRDLTSKSVIINDKLVIGWAGIRFKAESVIKHFQTAFSAYDGTFNKDLISSHLTQSSYAADDDIALIFHFITDSGVEKICWNTDSLQTKITTNLDIAGSGSGLFYGQLLKFSDLCRNKKEKILCVLQAVGESIVGETQNDNHYDLFYGFGFEITTIERIKKKHVLRKKPISYSQWIFDHQKDEIQNICITSQSYIGGELIYNTFDAKGDRNVSFIGAESTEIDPNLPLIKHAQEEGYQIDFIYLRDSQKNTANPVVRADYFKGDLYKFIIKGNGDTHILFGPQKISDLMKTIIKR